MFIRNNMKKIIYLMLCNTIFQETMHYMSLMSLRGLRVLPSGKERHFSKPRDTVLYRSHTRVINIYGGKLTTYRLVAERIMEKLRNVLPVSNVKSLTENITLRCD